jgi:peptidoglycan/LPS O-acetylase OafA/YrhL
VPNQEGEKAPYYPALDGLRAFSVLFVMYEHVTVLKSPLNHLHGWLGVDVFFVLSGFLITGLLMREETVSGKVDLTAFYIRRAFRILPLYWLILFAYVAMLQNPANHAKWMEMKVALPYFLTFNNEIPLLFMPDRVGTIFGLSWTLGVEEKFYIIWPSVCFLLFKSIRGRLAAGWAVYGATVILAFASFKICRAYSGLIVGAILALLLSGSRNSRLKEMIAKVPTAAVLLLAICAFALVDRNIRFVFVFSWAIGLLVASVAIKPSWLSKGLSNRVLVWIGKRSYAMYLIQGFGMQSLHVVFKPRSPSEEVAFTFGAFAVSCLGAALLRQFIEEPARRLGKIIVAQRHRFASLRSIARSEVSGGSCLDVAK